MQRQIDHLVYVVPNLEEAMKNLSQLLGVEIVYGGQHKTEGTHNALVNLGNNSYLELLAIDHSNTDIAAPRWMGIDLFDRPQLTRWAIKSNQLEQDAVILKTAHAEMGQIKAGSRKKTDGTTLKWALAMPLATPMVEVLPFMVDWKDSVHPTGSLASVCQLLALQATHPQPQQLLPTLDALGVKISLEQAETVALTAVIQTPKGVITL